MILLVKSNVLVVGSINMDLVARTGRMPIPGETLLGSEFRSVPGGKGANQAVAVARAGGNVGIIGMVGDDLFGHQLIRNLEQNNVDTSLVGKDAQRATGVAVILVDGEGENSIVVVPGANDGLSLARIKEVEDTIASVDMVLLQLEIPLEVVEMVIQIADSAGVPVILDPGPARALPRGLLALVDVITPNEHEAQILSGDTINNLDDAKKVAKLLLSWGIPNVLVKLGGEGVVAATDKGLWHVPGHKVVVEDTTAAGDSFAGGLAVALAEGYTMEQAVNFANAVGALAVTRLGAQTAIPTRLEVEKFMKDRGIPWP